MIEKSPGVQLYDVAGLDQAKLTLEEAFILPILHPELFTGGRQPYKTILFYGPPGAGKTRLAKAVATETDSLFCSVSPSIVTSKWYGESENIIRTIFETVRSKKAVLFFDECDALCGSRDCSSLDTIPRNIVSELLLQMDGMTTDDDNLVIIGATNKPWAIDSAILQRFEKRVYIPLPNNDARIEIIQIHLGESETSLENGDYDKLGNLTEGASGRDIKALVKRALMEPVRQCRKAKRFHLVEGFYMPCLDSSNCKLCRCKHCRKSKGGRCSLQALGQNCKSCGTKRWEMDDFPPGTLKLDKLCMDDFERALEEWHTTVKDDDLEEYETWTKTLGENGA
ncbi:hypothetical protein ACHAXR_003138 [Thalassiosira sp. AJA248-18]